jgi:superfamily I DNA/RNA helicase/RecB family exonuclease
VDWTPAQRQVLEHGAGWLQVRGPAGSGKTTTLVERWRRRAPLSGHPERVLVLCRSRDAADRFRRAALGDQAWAAESLPFTTLYGAAFDLVRRHRGERRLLTRAEQWTVVRRMLADDVAANWRSCPDFVGRAAFVDEVAGAVLDLEASGAVDDSVLAVAEACGQGERWRDLLDFRRRYRLVIKALGAVDAAQLFTEASEILSDPELKDLEARRWDEVLLDDAETITAPMGRLIERLAPAVLVAAGVDSAAGAGSGEGGGWACGCGKAGGGRPGVCWFDCFSWPAGVDFATRYRVPVPPSLLRCRHPATEADAIAGVLQEANDSGVPWSDMAVLVRSERQRAQSVGRGLARHGIPVRTTPGSAAAEPAVRTLTDFFAWAGGDESALERLLVSPAFDLGPTELRQIVRTASLGEAEPADHPRVAQLLALRDSMAPRLGSADPAALVHEAWVELLGGLVPDPDWEGSAKASTVIETRALDAVAAFLVAVGERASHDPRWRIADELALVEGPDFDPDPWVPVARPADDEMVAVSTIWAAGGRSWDTVVIAGCLEGELPRVSATVGYFDAAVPERAAGRGEAGLEAGLARAVAGEAGLARAVAGEAGHDEAGPGGVGPVPLLRDRLPSEGKLPTLAERRCASLEDQRRLFRLAASRARRKLVAAAAPAPGQLVSRFVGTTPDEVVRFTRPRVALGTIAPTPVPATEGVAPVHPDRRLSLSATRLKTYDDCPLRYFYQYALGVRGPGGVAASMGTVVHSALATFLDPHGSLERSWTALESLAQSLWVDLGWSERIAPYQPMREQARRDIFAMLQDWWLVESAQAEAAGAWPDVLAVEYPFDIDVAGHRVRGSIDRIDRVPGGIAIVDYKTGSRVLRAEDVAEDLQLATYHLAALRDPHLASVGPPVSLRLCYLRSGAQPAQTITDDHAARTEQRIVEAADRILSEDFEPSVEADCDYCDFKRLCPLQIEGRQVGWD